MQSREDARQAVIDAHHARQDAATALADAQRNIAVVADYKHMEHVHVPAVVEDEGEGFDEPEYATSIPTNESEYVTSVPAKSAGDAGYGELAKQNDWVGWFRNLDYEEAQKEIARMSVREWSKWRLAWFDATYPSMGALFMVLWPLLLLCAGFALWSTVFESREDLESNAKEGLATLKDNDADEKLVMRTIAIICWIATVLVVIPVVAPPRVDGCTTNLSHCPSVVDNVLHGVGCWLREREAGV